MDKERTDKNLEGFHGIEPSADFTLNVMKQIEAQQQTVKQKAFSSVFEFGVLGSIIGMSLIFLFGMNNAAVVSLFDGIMDSVGQFPIISSPIMALSFIGLLIVLSLELFLKRLHIIR